jgi:4-amino-4-deoxy-L-arabinose transferase-like glycosyltransferase
LSVNSVQRPHFGGWLQLFEHALPWMVLWCLMAAALIYIRPPVSQDELRLLGIAWEMWQRDVLLIPVLNELAAPEQPPLMPWLILLGWKIFGVNDWWPRVLPALFSLFSLFLVSRIAALLWMDQLRMPRYVPFVMLSSWLWVFYLTLTLTDHLLTFFTLLALFGILHAWRYTTRVGWFIFGFATGAAVLASGLTSLLYTLPVAIAGPLWAGREHALRWRNWYFDIGTGLVFAISLVALWGLVVSLEYGYGYAIDHLVGVLPEELKMFAQNQPIYSYLVLLPVAFLPWVAWPLVYSRALQVSDRLPSIGFIFCAAWVVPVLVVLSVLGPRQPQYLLPILPAFALLVTYLLFNDELIDQGEDRFVVSLMFPTMALGLVLLGIAFAPDASWLPAALKGISPVVGGSITLAALLVFGLPRSGLVVRVVIIVLGVSLAAAPSLPNNDVLPAVLTELPIYVGIVIALLGSTLGLLPTLTFEQRVVRIAVFNIVLVIAAQWYVTDKNEYQSVITSARFLGQMELDRSPVAHMGTYHGQFHFYGRLRNAYKEVTPEDILAWVAANPAGVVITYGDGWQPRVGNKSPVPLFESPYAGTTLRIFSAAAL